MHEADYCLPAASWPSAFGAAQAQTVNILMESVPDTEYVKALLPEFKAETGIDVELEVINYIDMHTKLVPQLLAPQGQLLTPSSSTSTGSASSPRPAGCCRWTS